MDKYGIIESEQYNDGFNDEWIRYQGDHMPCTLYSMEDACRILNEQHELILELQKSIDIISGIAAQALDNVQR